MKITLSAAMRARDVSRPRAEQVAEDTGREEPAIQEQGAPHAVGDAPDAPQLRTRPRHRIR